MGKLVRMYNQNRKQIFIAIIIILFIFGIIQLLNVLYKENNKNKINKENQTEKEDSIQKDFKKESESLISDDKIEDIYKTDFGNLIETFLQKCTENQYDEAYDLLTQDCKNTLYPSKEIFVDQYCLKKFEKGKTYDFQAWSTKGAYIYLVKIYDNILSTGKLTNKSYIQDYYSVIAEDENYKLNINGYLGLLNRNNNAEKENIKITVNYSKIYMDYEIYTLTIKNNSDKYILLDIKEETDTVYVLDENNYKYEAFMFETLDEDLIIGTDQEKEIEIRFSNNYNEEIKMKKLVFSNIVRDYNNYTNNKEEYNDYLKLEVGM